MKAETKAEKSIDISPNLFKGSKRFFPRVVALRYESRSHAILDLIPNPKHNTKKHILHN